MTLVGVGYRKSLSDWVAKTPLEIECLEITAEHFFDQTERVLKQAVGQYPVFVHGLGLSLATPGRPDQETLENFQRVVEVSQPEWISEHVAFTRTSEVDLGHLNPVPPSAEMLDRIAENALALSTACGKKLILENITSNLKLEGEMDEPEFLNRLCEQANVGLLLDVTNLFVNSKNHGFDPIAWLQQLRPENIVQLHIVGYSRRDNRWFDNHAKPIQDDLLELLSAVVDFADVQAVIVERDEQIPSESEYAAELRKLKAVCGAN